MLIEKLYKQQSPNDSGDEQPYTSEEALSIGLYRYLKRSRFHVIYCSEAEVCKVVCG